MWKLFRKTQRPKLVFVHLPRTGGTTLTYELLLNAVPRNQLFSVNEPDPASLGCMGGSVDDLLGLPDHVKEKLSLIVGHMPFGVADQFPGGWLYITFLRHPVARVISEYYQARGVPSNSAHPFARDLSLDEYVRAGYGNSHNGMTRALANEVYGRVYTSAQEMLRAALHSVSRCAFVGFTEHFDSCVDVLCSRFGWAKRSLDWTNRFTPKNHAIDKSTEEVIRRFNMLDLELYQTMFEKRWCELAG